MADGTATLSGAVGYKAESGRKMTVKDSVTLAQSSSNAFTVVPADVASFTFSTVNNVKAGATIPSVTVSAFDQYGNLATNYHWHGPGRDGPPVGSPWSSAAGCAGACPGQLRSA